MNPINKLFGICILLAALVSAFSLAECDVSIDAQDDPIKLAAKSAARSTENQEIVESINAPDTSWIQKQVDNVGDQFEVRMKKMRDRVLPIVGIKETVDVNSGAAPNGTPKPSVDDPITSVRNAIKGGLDKVENKINDDLGVHIPFTKTIEKDKENSLVQQVIETVVKGKDADKSKRSKSKQQQQYVAASKRKSGRFDGNGAGTSILSARAAAHECILSIVKLLSEIALNKNLHENVSVTEMLNVFKTQLESVTTIGQVFSSGITRAALRQASSKKAAAAAASAAATDTAASK